MTDGGHATESAGLFWLMSGELYLSAVCCNAAADAPDSGCLPRGGRQGGNSGVREAGLFTIGSDAR